MIPTLSSCHLMLLPSAVFSSQLGKITPYLLVQFSESRSDSYELVSRNFAFFRKWTDTKVKMTIGPQSIAHIFESIQRIHANGFSIAANVVFEDVWGDKKAEYLRAFWRELDKLINFYLENREWEPPYLIDVPLDAILYPREKERRFCGSGSHMVTYDVDGKQYPCHRFAPMSSDRPEEKPDLRFNGIKPGKCDACILLSVCPSCIGHNYEMYGDVDTRTTFHCEFIKLQVLASAKFTFRKLQEEIKIHPASECETLDGARIKRAIESIRIVSETITVSDVFASQ